MKTASSRFQVTPNRARREKEGQGCLFTKNLQKVPRYDHDIYTKYLSMYIRVSHFGVIFPNHSASGRDLCASH